MPSPHTTRDPKPRNWRVAPTNRPQSNRGLTFVKTAPFDDSADGEIICTLIERDDAELIAAAPELAAVAASMIVSGPDNDGLLWLMFSGPGGGPKGALSVRAHSVAGRALSLWRDERDAAVAKAGGRP